MSAGFVNGHLDLDVIDLGDSASSADNHRDTSNRRSTASRPGSSAANIPKVPLLMLNKDETTEVILSGIFGFEGKSYDASLHSSSITLTIINGKVKGKFQVQNVKMFFMCCCYSIFC